jgi:UV DNA damage endonuclease
MLRLGLCCVFRDQPIKFGVTTASALQRLPVEPRRRKLSDLCRANANALRQAIIYCADNGIGCFRILSQILPLKTHPMVGYDVDDLPEGPNISQLFRECGELAKERGIRLCFHPDQFVVLNSRRPDVVTASLQEIEYQAEVAEWVGADVVNIHGGGAFGDKQKSLGDFERALDRLSPRTRAMLTVENDDKIYTPADLLPLCRSAGVPLVYDVHHHRCLPDALSVEEATELAIETWPREPMFHISSPLDGWNGPRPERHHDFIDVRDFPDCWRDRDLTVEVEAKAKEAAVVKLIADLAKRRRRVPKRAK